MLFDSEVLGEAGRGNAAGQSCAGTHLQHTECNQHLLVYPDLPSARC